MKTQTKKIEIKTALKEIIFSLIIINTLLNRVLYAYTLVNSECLCFGMMIKKTVEWNKLKWFLVSLQKVINVIDKTGTINKMTKIHINIDEYIKICYFYIENNNFKYNLILNKS